MVIASGEGFPAGLVSKHRAMRVTQLQTGFTALIPPILCDLTPGVFKHDISIFSVFVLSRMQSGMPTSGLVSTQGWEAA